MDFVLRPEAPADHRAVERLTKRAFLTMELPGREVCDEHLLAHKLRKSAAFVPALDFVAVAVEEDGGEGDVVGNIMYSRARVAAENGGDFAVLTFGPLSVEPAWQGRGVGAALVRHTAAEACRLGWPAILIFGHPGYYPRFGFRPAAAYGISAPDGSAPDALMALACSEGALEGVRGRFFTDPVFEMDLAELAEFELFLARRPDSP